MVQCSWAHLRKKLLVVHEEAADRWEHTPAITHPWYSLRHAPVTKLWGRWATGQAHGQSSWPKPAPQVSGQFSLYSISSFFLRECKLASVLLICHYLTPALCRGIRLTFCPENRLNWRILVLVWWQKCTESATLTLAALLTNTMALRINFALTAYTQ